MDEDQKNIPDGELMTGIGKKILNESFGENTVIHWNVFKSTGDFCWAADCVGIESPADVQRALKWKLKQWGMEGKRVGVESTAPKYVLDVLADPGLHLEVVTAELDAPYITTLFFGWPGGTWSPATLEEYLYRRRLMPENCACTVTIMCEEQMDILAAAIVNGDNVRVGTEDYPFNQQGKVCTTHELVKEIADISRSLGRDVATVTQAREMLGL